jgi:cytochrome P450
MQQAILTTQSLDAKRCLTMEAPFTQLRDRILDSLLELQRRFGSIACWEDAPDRLYVVFGPDLNRVVLSQTDVFHSCFCPIRGPRQSSQRRLTNGLLTMNGSEHRLHRQLINRLFHPRTIAAYRSRIIPDIERMLDEWRCGEVVDIRSEMDRLILRINCTLLFGTEDWHLALRTGALIEEFLDRNHEVGIAAISSRAVQDHPYFGLLSLAERMEAQVRELIAARRNLGCDGDDLLAFLLRARDENLISEDELIGHTTLFFGAANSTTAYSLIWTILLAALHPAIFSELQAECAPRTGHVDDLVESQPSLLTNVIKESQRILPASAYVQRVASRPVQLGPFQLRRGESVVFSQFVSHRIPSVFPEPSRFIPERWNGPPPPPYAYIPFGFGPRICLGISLAATIIRTVLPMIWRRFTLSLADDADVTLRVRATMLAPAGGVPMRLQPPATVPIVPARVAGDLQRYVELPG